MVMEEKTLTSLKLYQEQGLPHKSVLRKFGQQTIVPQQFASPVTKKGNVAGIPQTRVLLQETSARAWDEINVILMVNVLQKQDDRGNVLPHSVTVKLLF